MADSQEVNELKHSIKAHLLINGGPSQQLCAFLVKVIDLIEDSDQARKKIETLGLAFNVVEAVGLHVQQAIDARHQVSQKSNQVMPENVRKHSDEILIAIGKARGFDDKSKAKTCILSAVGKSLDSLGTFTKAIYPTLFDIDGNKLSNHGVKGGEAQAV